MLNVGLTGNIAAGKSTVVGFLKRWGATIIDADELARAAQTPGNEALTSIVRRFGSDVLAPDGSLDRAALRSKVMGDESALAALNAIVHPVVQQRRAVLQTDSQTRGDLLVVNEIPLLFEAADPAQFDVIVLVDAPVALRRTRLRAMRGLSNDDADRMIAAQMPAERKRALSQFVIENSSTLKQLEARTRGVFKEIRHRAALKATGVGASGTLAIVAADAKDTPPELPAIAGRYTDAGVNVEQLDLKTGDLAAKLERATPPLVVLATIRASQEALRVWEAAGKPGTFVYLSEDPDPVAVRLDLRPWGADYVALAEVGASGLKPRPDLFPSSAPSG
ncbi:MAG TPA: dephospho-CoA kinase [Gemmatimonadales bacterium]|nr:dephospho-CoA kinase [Gemmatimonadales bacterium]